MIRCWRSRNWIGVSRGVLVMDGIKWVRIVGIRMVWGRVKEVEEMEYWEVSSMPIGVRQVEDRGRRRERRRIVEGESILEMLRYRRRCWDR